MKKTLIAMAALAAAGSRWHSSRAIFCNYVWSRKYRRLLSKEN